MVRILPRIWLISVLILLTATAAFAEPQAYELQVDGLACPFCAYGVEKQLSRIEGVKTIDTDIATSTITVTTADGAALDESAAQRAVEAAGFSLRDFQEVQATAKIKME